MPRQRCPHTEVRYCPLYHASHGHELDPSLGCTYGDFDRGCAVERGEITYKRSVARLCKTAAGAQITAQLAWRESAAAAKAQRERNMRLAGIRG